MLKRFFRIGYFAMCLAAGGNCFGQVAKPAEQQKPAPGASARTLDEFRAEMKKKSTEIIAEGSGMMSAGMPGGMGPGGMGGQGMGGQGMGGMGGGMLGGEGGQGMPGMGGRGGGMIGGMGMGPGGIGSGMGMGGEGMQGGMVPASEKENAAKLISQIRRRLGSKQYQREKVQKQLQIALKQYFDADMEERVRELDRVKAKLADLESKLQRRLENESAIIDLQLTQMIHKADGLDFSVPNANPEGNMGGMGGGGFGGGYGSGMSPMDGSEGSGFGTPNNTNQIGYDASFGMTRFERLDTSELDTTDPLKVYKQLKATTPSPKFNDNNAGKLEVILEAFHQFESRFQHFPRSANKLSLQQPEHSWRIAILPLIGESELYSAYQFDQPWNSEHNLKVAAKMPELFRTKPGTENTTGFKMVVGGGAFDSGRFPPRMYDITDGTSNTIALIESDREVVWTKPEDAEFSTSGKLPGLLNPGLVGMADGTVRKVNNSSEQFESLRAMFTRSAGDPVTAPAVP